TKPPIFSRENGGEVDNNARRYRSSVERRMALMMDHERWVPSPGDACSSTGRWHFLYFFPLPHQQGAFRPSLRFPVRSGRGRAAEAGARAAVRSGGGGRASRAHGGGE